MPSAPPAGTSMSALMVYEAFRMKGESPCGRPTIGWV
ncbi:MAG: hypothetical protein BWX79_03107 [Alphaproteobacteria bacterium ADurb.Bin100]|nr:MAG: hypothetical protein BWX79_03107 [Alphaproteobacteria bacterium ADurb.Bin100]